MALWIQIALVVAGTLVVALGGLIVLGVVLARGDAQTNGLTYFGASPPERARLRKRLALHRRLLSPWIHALARLRRPSMEMVTFHEDGVPGPQGTCSAESFKAAMQSAFRPGDVVVATQMKCGTTWMLNVVYEILTRGSGALADEGTALSAVVPWLESTKGVTLEDAPALGQDPGHRLVKTHLPASACPRHEEARFIYVSRHPGSCFASTADFVAENMGPFTPSLPEVEAWFCSEHMWWGPWPDHVSGWWERSRTDANVLCIRFEDMKNDLSAVVAQVADFLQIGLTEQERQRVCDHAAFDYMRRHWEVFEMHPPHLLAPTARFFRSGSARRFEDVPGPMLERIEAWCGERSGDAPFYAPVSEA